MPVPPVINEAFTFYVTLTSQADTDVFQTNPTLAAGDVQVSIDGGAFANLATLPTVTPAGGEQVRVSLSAGEMNGDAIGVLFSDAAGNEWQDLYILILTDTQEIGDIPTAAQTSDAVWDEVLTAATHNVGYSAGQRLRYLILTGATAQGGTANSITLAATESATDDIFIEDIISIVAGTGAGQTRLIAEYNGTTKVAYVDKAWFTAPDATSVYEILPFSSILVAHHGLVQAATATTVTLEAGASATDDIYIGSTVFISSGTGFGQIRLITDYVGLSKICTISDAWTTTPDITSVYKLIPVGRVIIDELSTAMLDDISEDVWGYSSRTLTQSATQVAAVVQGSAIAVKSYTTWDIDLTGIGNISSRTALYFTVKNDLEDEADSASICQIEETLGLLYMNGSAASNALMGSITVTDAATGALTITVNSSVTGIGAKTARYGIKMVTATTVQAMCEGSFSCDAPPTRALT